MSKIKVAGLAFIVMTVSGCVNVYQPASHGPKAKLGLEATNIPLLVNNEIVIFDDPYTCRGPKYLSQLKDRFLGNEMVSIPANKLATVNVATHGMYNFRVSFYPRANNSYVIRAETYKKELHIGYNELFGRMQIFRIEKDANGKKHYHQVKMVIRKKKYYMWFNNLSPCEDTEVQRKLKRIALKKYKNAPWNRIM